jgi:hypothetical protein
VRGKTGAGMSAGVSAGRMGRAETRAEPTKKKRAEQSRRGQDGSDGNTRWSNASYRIVPHRTAPHCTAPRRPPGPGPDHTPEWKSCNLAN